ncbi:tetratricopeptide repeat protein [Bradyrhizobium tropiciagri]|uniref:tetratricopeptide repeat protein n=1 Tax=Bradyrhizobium tropiciagri TaxID=312253 RepID=UPI001BAB742F|nr:tetratricopeptide repeat protein [Bradyrhizobium tropiciagri]MBR0873106.1 tetratricopeptide repeat protein [Bradyrhizobium tropiciagri]
MKRRCSLLVFATLVCSAIAAQAETLLDAKCTGKSDVAWDAQVTGCTAVIASGKFAGKDLAKALTNRAQAYAQTGDLDHSLADIEQVIRLAPDDAFAFGARGDIHLVRKDYDRALADYDKAIALAPDNDLALAARGIVFLAKGEFDRARSEFDHAIRLQPASATALYWRGIARRQKGDATAGDADIAAAKKIDPNIDQ